MFPVPDSYKGGEILAEQAGAGAALTFTFADWVDRVCVHARDSEVTPNICHADPFGGTPTNTLGIVLQRNTTYEFNVRSRTIKVYAPANSTVCVWGYRRHVP